MNELPFRRLTVSALGIVILFTMIAWNLHETAVVRGVWIAALWQVASGWCLVRCARLLSPPFTKRRRWHLVGFVCLKFPGLYGLGYLALRWFEPSALGLVVGLTVPWVVLVSYAVVRLVTEGLPPTVARSR